MKIFTFLAILLLISIHANAVILECVDIKGHTIYTNTSGCPLGYVIKGTQGEAGAKTGASDSYLESFIQAFMTVGYTRLEAIEMVQCEFEYSDTIKINQCQKLVK